MPDAAGASGQSGGMHEMLKRHAVQVLREAGLSQADVARRLCVSERSVRAIEAEPAVATIDDAAERKHRCIGRPSKAEPFRRLVTELMAKEPELLSLEVLRRARLAGYGGGKSALYALVASVRPAPLRPIVRFEGLPGEFTQHDFGHVEVRFIDGRTKRVHFFATRLKYSRHVEVTLVDNEQTETIVRTLVVHFDRIGGVPLVAVFDQPKTIVKVWRDGRVVEYNPTFAQAMLEMGVGVEVCWPRSGQQKGAVENLVGWVKGSFFKQRRFVDDDDLVRQLAEWHHEVNTERPSRATGFVPSVRLAEERARFRPLRVAPADLALRFPVFVGPTGYVTFETQQYSMVGDAIGIAGTLYLYRDRVRIVAGRFESTHERLLERGAKSTLPGHRATHVAAVSGRRGKLYLKRQQLLDLGPVLFEYLTELVHRRPLAWNVEIERMHDLLESYGQSALVASTARALRERCFGAEYVAHHIDEGVAALGEALAGTRLPSSDPTPQDTNSPTAGRQQELFRS
jgi:transposase